MKQDVKERWVAALRSGEYQQGKRKLRNVDSSGGESYCCLGVLAEICGVRSEYRDGRYVYLFPFPEGLGQSATFPSDEFLQDLGIDVSLAKTLAEKNDAGVPFSYIADKIERDL